MNNKLNKGVFKNDTNENTNSHKYLNVTDNFGDEIYKLQELIEKVPKEELEDYLLELNDILKRIIYVRDNLITKINEN